MFGNTSIYGINMMQKILSIIDHLWYVGEKLHQQEKSPGDGALLVAICWYGSFFLPLLSLIYRLKTFLIIQIILGITLIIIPFVFCRVRYNKLNRELIESRYKNKKEWGKSLFKVWTVLIIVVLVEFIVLIKTGFWHLGA